MIRLVSFILVVFFFSIIPSFADGLCGTARILENLKNQGKTLRQLLYQKPLAQTDISSCTASDLYDSVYTKKTEHFEIFYTLDGPHQTTTEFIDSLVNTLEYTWNFHVRKSGMRAPIGGSETYQYQKTTTTGLYPVEVLDIDLLRNTKSILNRVCHGCYGLTFPFDSTRSELMIDNDFRFTPLTNAKIDSTHFHGKNCPYTVATEPLVNTTYGYSYAERWINAIRITAAHELYHAIQLRYLDMFSYINLWYEASAVGMENVIYSEVNDYIAYLREASESVGTPLDKMDNDYGASPLFLYLYNHVGHDTDKLIWESFARQPNRPFQDHLAKAVSKRKLSSDSLFHDFATRLAFAGRRSSLVDSSFWIDRDQPLWSDYRINAQSGNFSVRSIDSLAFQFYSNGTPDLGHFTGKTSAIALNKHSYKVRFLPTTNSVDSVRVEFANEADLDSVIWITSRFSESEITPTTISDSTLRAYPTPWRHGLLCFTPLPQGKKHLEIRNRRGNLIEKIPYDSSTLCLDENKVKSMLVPGVYRFRAGNNGKTKDFIVIY